MTVDHPSRIGEYDVLGVIGKGSMGVVYKAVQPSVNRVVAIKVLSDAVKKDPEGLERFHREAEAVALLNHPNIVQLVEKGDDDEMTYFVMEYVPGSSLAAVMRQRRLSLPEILMVFKQVCRGLEAAHRENVIHRDLNPRNILVSEDLRVAKIADFGIGRVEAISQEHGTLSTSAVSLGTLHYMAPEQSANMVATDHRSDIYSAGVLLYEMLTGRVPVGRFNLPSQINNDVPPEFDPIVLKCLETKPVNRYPSVGGILKDVARLEDQLRLGLVSDLRGIKASTSKIILGSTKPFRKKKSGLIAAVVALVLIAGVIATVLLLRDEGATATPTEAAQSEGQAQSQLDIERGGEAPTVAGTDQSGGAGSEEAAALGFDDAADSPAAESDDPAALRSEDLPEPPPAESEERVGETPVVVEARDDQSAREPSVAADPPPAPASETTNATALETARSAARDLQVIAAKVDAGLYAPALDDLGTFIERNGDSPLLVDARLLEGQIHEKEGKIELAKATYVEVLSRHAGETAAGEAGYRLGTLFLAEGGRESLSEAREAFGRTAVEYPSSTWAPLALAAKAKAEDEAKLIVVDSELKTRAPAAVATWKALVESYPDHARAEQAWWGLGEAYEHLKRYERAADAFQSLMRHFPNSRLEGWWKAGHLYDRKLDRKDDARLAYLQVPESSRHYRDAVKRLGKLQ